MNSKLKMWIGGIIIIVFGSIAFTVFSESKIEYVDFKEAENRLRKVEVKGYWLKDKETKFDGNSNTFVFHMKDDSNTEMKVIYEGAKPNNFEVAEAIVVKGKIKDGNFLASDILTKCPSKYEASPEDIKKEI